MRAVSDPIIQRYKADPGIDNVQQALERACEANRFDPVLDYLNSLVWDGTPRLDRWLSTYMGADDTDLNRAQGRLVLIAAVRRVRRPGSSSIRSWCSKGRKVRASPVQSRCSPVKGISPIRRSSTSMTTSRWNCCEASGCMSVPSLRRSKSEVDHVKAFASRTEDRGRPAYGRHVVKRPRRCVVFATTNNDRYLKSQTGDRRFWPVRTGRVDLDLLRRDRDQLFAEAAHLEAMGASLVLPSRLWDVARMEQEKRQEADPWEDALACIKGESLSGGRRGLTGRTGRTYRDPTAALRFPSFGDWPDHGPGRETPQLLHAPARMVGSEAPAHWRQADQGVLPTSYALSS